MGTIKTLLSILLFCFSITASSQSIADIIIERKIERILENNDQSIDDTKLRIQLLYLYKNPENLNKGEFQLLREVRLLNAYQISILTEYLNLMGKIESVKELYFLDGFSKKEVDELLNFITLKDISTKNFNRTTKHKIYTGFIKPIQSSKGFKEPKVFAGTNEKMVCRYHFNKNNQYSLNIIGEKDIGEPFFSKSKNIGNSKPPLLFDYISGNFEYKPQRLLKKILLGDYQLQFGQGLCMWSNYALNKSLYINDLIKYAGGIKANTSANENRFFRGIACTFKIKSLNISFFYSNKYRDANLITDTTFSSLQNTGLHRTTNELTDKHSLKEKIRGGNIQFNHGNLKLGATYYRQEFDKHFILNDQLSQKFNFTGKINKCFGLDFRTIINKFELFGEISCSGNKSKAFISGFNYYASSLLKIHFHYRNYSKSFQNFYSGSIGENSGNKNEKAVFTAVELQFHPYWSMSAYTDFFKFPWLKYGINFPSQGNEQSVQLNFNYSESFTAYVRYKREQKLSNQTNRASWFNYPTIKITQSFRIHFDYIINSYISMQSRLEWKKYEHDKQIHNGFLFLNEINLNSLNHKWKSSLRWAVFSTDNYESRIYTYEKDLKHTFSIPAFYGTGSRVYFILQYKPSKRIKLKLKYAQTGYSDRNKIGSGLNMIDGNLSSEIKAELQINL